MKTTTASFDSGELVASTEAHKRWKCGDCWLDLPLWPQSAPGRAPKCPRCGRFALPVNGHPDDVTGN